LRKRYGSHAAVSIWVMHVAIEFLSIPPDETSAKVTPVTPFSAGTLLGPFLNNDLGTTAAFFPVARQCIAEKAFGPAHTGQMSSPSGPFAIYGSQPPGATLVLPELAFFGIR
jgi:hypothetical protein